jgi:hypothetical protein
MPTNKDVTLDGNNMTTSGGVQLASTASYQVRVTNITFSASATVVTVSGAVWNNKPWRIDHCIFNGSGTNLIEIDESPGLIDHCSFPNLSGNQETIHARGAGASLWTTANEPGGIHALYIEDSTFTGGTANSTCVHQIYEGARVVDRHNTFSKLMVEIHGTSGQVGARWWEIYSNTFTNGAFYCIRAGTGIIFGNAGGSGVMVEEDSGYPADYQVGTGQNKTLYPAYTWGNASAPELNAGGVCANAASGMIAFDRDVYSDVAGTNRITSGTSTPTSCSHTNQAFWNTSTSPGKLYKCNGSTYDLYYTPWPYPYPLNARGMPDITGVGDTDPIDNTLTVTKSGTGAGTVTSSP